MGATTFSFAVNLGVFALLGDSPEVRGWPVQNEQRPQEYQCDVRRVLWKSLDQPELKRRDVWHVRPDGTNVDEAVEDARSVLLTTGMAWLAEFSDLSRILRFYEAEEEEWDPPDAGVLVGPFGPGRLGSPQRRRVSVALRRRLGVEAIGGGSDA